VRPVTPDDPGATAPRPGDLVTVRYTKWDRSPHWTYPATYLGDDEFGRWVGGGPGTVLERPGASLAATIHFAVLFPIDGRWTPCFNEPDPTVTNTAIYTDVTNHPEWRLDGEGWTVTMVDLDLDVVKRRDGSVHIDDEDEFAEHQVAMQYPSHVIARARVDCAGVYTAMERGDEPYGSVGRSWLERFIDGRPTRERGC
jgi:hypothetical protein